MTFPPGAGPGREAGDDVSRVLSVVRASAVPRRGVFTASPRRQAGRWRGSQPCPRSHASCLTSLPSKPRPPPLCGAGIWMTSAIPWVRPDSAVGQHFEQYGTRIQVAHTENLSHVPKWVTSASTLPLIPPPQHSCEPSLRKGSDELSHPEERN